MTNAPDPDPVVANQNEAGRACPYCRFPLKEGTLVIHCMVCDAVHHAECWDENRGCAVVACAGASVGAAPERGRPVVAHVSAESGSGQQGQAPHGGRAAKWLVVGALILAAAAGGGVVAFVLSNHSSPQITTSSLTSSGRPPVVGPAVMRVGLLSFRVGFSG